MAVILLDAGALIRLVVIVALCAIKPGIEAIGPEMSVPEEYIHNSSDENPIQLTITCKADSEIIWHTHIPSDIYDINKMKTASNFISTFKVVEPYPSDSGNLSCADAKGREDSTYIYVSGFGDFQSYAVQALVEIGENEISLFLDCSTTRPDIHVDVYKEYEKIPAAQVDFDPKFGVVISGIDYLSGHYECKTENDQNSFQVIYKVDDDIYTPDIQDSINSYFIDGKPFDLICSVPMDDDKEDRLTLSWDFPKIDVRNSYRIKSGSGQRKLWSTLSIRRAQLSDSGSYTCIARLNENTKEHTINITVKEFQENFVDIIVQDDVREVDVKSGDSLTWVARVKAYPSNISYHIVPPASVANGSLGQVSMRLDYLSGSFIMEIDNVGPENHGRYTLEIDNGLSNDSEYFLLSVRAPPLIEFEQNPFCQHNYGELANLSTVILSNSNLTLVWYFSYECPEGISAPCLNETEIAFDLGSPSTNESNRWDSSISLDTTQSGFLEIHAFNDEGESHAFTHLTICDKYGAYFFIQDTEIGVHKIESFRETVTVIEDDDITLSCGGMMYLYNDVFIGHSDLRNPPTNCSDEVYLKQCLTLSNINRTAESSTYACNAIMWGNNNSKILIAEIKVLPKEAPSIKEGSNVSSVGTSVSVLPGNHFFLSCFVDGAPPPRVIWRKDAIDVTKIDNFLNDVTSLEDRNQTLDFAFAQMKHAGKYDCYAENRVGSVMKFAQVVIEGMEQPNVDVTLIVFAVLSVSILILIVAYLYFKIRKERKLRLEFRRNQLFLFAKGNVNELNPDATIDEQADLLPYDQSYEVDREKIKIGKCLGSGAFGRVMLGEVYGLEEDGKKSKVAVKMCKDISDPSHLRALTLELKIMIHIGRHLNIVNLMGAYSVNIVRGELWILVEYCPYGQLLQFILKHKSKFLCQINQETGLLDSKLSNPISPSTTYDSRLQTSSSDAGTDGLYDFPSSTRKISAVSSVALDPSAGFSTPTMYVGNPQYQAVAQSTRRESQRRGRIQSNIDGSLTKKRLLSTVSSSAFSNTGERSLLDSQGNHHFTFDDAIPGINEPFTTLTCISWAWQVALGMEYLASRKVLHSDLAARNLLLANHNVVKICDFGLSRDMYKKDIYVKKEGDILPIKWMSLEAIQRRQFSTQSDVWAFGITIWEIFTLGKTPYPGVPINNEFVVQLEDGMRLPKPKYSTNELYGLMNNCWKETPEERPNFSDIAVILENMIFPDMREDYIAMNDVHKLHNERYFGNKTDYLDMISSPDFLQLQNAAEDDIIDFENQSVESPNIDNYLAMDAKVLSSPPSAAVFSPRPCSSENDNKFEFPMKIKNVSEDISRGEVGHSSDVEKSDDDDQHYKILNSVADPAFRSKETSFADRSEENDLKHSEDHHYNNLSSLGNKHHLNDKGTRYKDADPEDQSLNPATKNPEKGPDSHRQLDQGMLYTNLESLNLPAVKILQRENSLEKKGLESCDMEEVSEDTSHYCNVPK